MKRGLFNFLGKAQSWLIGTATKDKVSESAMRFSNCVRTRLRLIELLGVRAFLCY